MNFGRYKVIDELGKGAMGVVYRGHDPQIDRTVALKVLRHDRLTSEDFISRFLKEAKAIGRLSHANIVTVYDVGQDHDTIYIAMEFLEGKPLDEHVAQSPLTFAQIIQIGIQIAETLDYAHNRGIVHRDIKPTNIIFTKEGNVKITDFGIAHIEDPEATQQTQAGEILGTPTYMSPEQVLGKPVDGRSDIYALGVLLYELSTKHRPFTGNTLAAVFNAITNVEAVPPHKYDPSIPHPFSQTVLKCLQKNPDQRFQNGRELAAALKKSQPENIEVTRGGASSGKRIIVSLLLLVVCLLSGIGAYLYLAGPDNKPALMDTRPETAKKLRFEFTSDPPGAQLYMDGKFKGNTPLTLELPGGTYEVKLSLDNYYEWEASLNLNENSKKTIHQRLFAIEE